MKAVAGSQCGKKGHLSGRLELFISTFTGVSIETLFYVQESRFLKRKWVLERGV